MSILLRDRHLPRANEQPSSSSRTSSQCPVRQARALGFRCRRRFLGGLPSDWCSKSACFTRLVGVGREEVWTVLPNLFIGLPHHLPILGECTTRSLIRKDCRARQAQLVRRTPHAEPAPIQ